MEQRPKLHAFLKMLIVLLLAHSIVAVTSPQQAGNHGKLRVSQNHRFLEYEDGTTFQTYTPPTSGRGNDWILIIEDVSKEFLLPGTM
jgi:hypothetical protein